MCKVRYGFDLGQRTKLFGYYDYDRTRNFKYRSEPPNFVSFLRSKYFHEPTRSNMAKKAST